MAASVAVIDMLLKGIHTSPLTGAFEIAPGNSLLECEQDIFFDVATSQNKRHIAMHLTIFPNVTWEARVLFIGNAIAP